MSRKRGSVSHLLLSLGYACAILLTSGCVPKAPSGTSESHPKSRPSVIATIFPLYDFARTVLGTRIQEVDLFLLVPPGVELHAYDPSPKDAAAVAQSRLFIYLSPAMEPWAENLVANAQAGGDKVLEAAGSILGKGGPSEASRGAEDPHVWLDPILAVELVRAVSGGLARTFPEWRADIEANAAAYSLELVKLDDDFKSAFARCSTRTIIAGGHFAFGRFALRYGLEYLSPYRGFSPDAEPTAKQVAELVKTIRSTSTKYIFYEELVDPKVARVLAESTGAGLLLLHGAHNLGKGELESGIDYLGIMRGNLERLKIGLGYR